MNKRIYGIYGPPRSGKDVVAQFLNETRYFKVFSFADQIKKEYGISKEDFEKAKLSGESDLLRNELWEFSKSKKEDDPLYFIKGLVDEALEHESSVITDVRTENEYRYLYDLHDDVINKFIYIYNSVPVDALGDGRMQIIGSELTYEFINEVNHNNVDTVVVYNNYKGLVEFFSYLEKVFKVEDVMDLFNVKGDDWRWKIQGLKDMCTW